MNPAVKIISFQRINYFFNAIGISADNTGVMLKNILKQQIERRRYIRHPAEIAVEYTVSGKQEKITDLTKDISFGGIRFQGHSYIEPGTILNLTFPSIHPDYEVAGKVVWCSQKKDHVEMGLEFLDENEAYRANLIEEIGHLKSIQQERLVKES